MGYDQNTTLEINLSQCTLPTIQDESCLALPGDKILAQITRQGKLILHRTNCRHIKAIGLENLTSVLTTNDTARRFLTKIQVLVTNEPGTFAKLSGVMGEKGINIIELTQAAYTNEVASISATIGVTNLTEVEDLIKVFHTKDFIQKAIML